MSTKSTRKVEKSERDTLRVEYGCKELGSGVRGKYAGRFANSLVLLSPDVAEAFPDSDSVNEALRGLIHIAERTAKPNTPRRSRS